MHHQHQLLQLADDASSSSMGLLFSFQKDGTIGVRLYYGYKYNGEMNIHENFSYKTFQKTSGRFPLNAIVGSCNGLICLNRYHHGIPDPIIHICNPNTGEYANLPEYTLREKYYAAAYGFGYIHGQYKVVRICYPKSDNYAKGEVQVYTIGSGTGWRTIGTTSSYRLLFQNPLGIFINGSLHWIDGNKIVTFNLADEEFRIIQSPSCNDLLQICFCRLQSLRGNLCLCHQRDEQHLLDIWSLKKNATTEASWSRDFSIAYPSGWEVGWEFSPLLITKKNEVLLVHRASTIYCYDPKTNTVMKLWDDDEKSGLQRLNAVPHMNSFVSLKALGERCESKKKVRT